ncbi:MAG: di-trans,poly-cis-decaprenylcistransferase [Clostridia bacterium]|nr:di-trans,poly-cis-decaprenylcistransferase [Clostridia bacterium]
MTDKTFVTVPKHMGLIIDGNGRWAKRRGMTRPMGHKAGFARLKKILPLAFRKGVKHISVYCFSTENWNRPQPEVDYLMEIFRDTVTGNFLDEADKKYSKPGDKKLSERVRINFMGDPARLPEDIQKGMIDTMERTKNNDEFVLNLGINYGAYDEMLIAMNNMIKDGVTKVTREVFENYLFTKGQPPLDYIVRTSGEHRLSGFMLWQASYAEFYFPKVHWPDFTEKELDKALEEFQKRNRRFGAIKEDK